MKLDFHESGVWQPKSPRQSAVISSVPQNADPHTIPPPPPPNPDCFWKRGLACFLTGVSSPILLPPLYKKI